MPVTKQPNGPEIITPARTLNTLDGQISGATKDRDFSVTGYHDSAVQLQVDLSSSLPGGISVLKTATNLSTTVVLTLPGTTGTLALTGSEGQSFTTIQTPSGTSPVATGPTDTLTLTCSPELTITGNATTDQVNFSIRTASASQSGAVSSTDFSTFSAKASTIDIQTFTSSGTWTKPVGVKYVLVACLGGGGGGGSGRKGASLSTRCGGGGGAGSCLTVGQFSATLLGNETVTVGAGGAGGAGQTTDSTNGNSGSSGGTSSFGSFLKGVGGNLGAGGTGVGGNGGLSTVTSPSPWNFTQMPGANASGTGGPGVSGNQSRWASPTGGAAGCGISNTDVISTGGIGGSISSFLIPGLVVAGGAAGVAAPANAGNGIDSDAYVYGMSIGTGGGSSRSSITTNTGNGGNGGLGAGGGGSGAAQNGAGNSGNGGNGGSGWVVVVSYF